MTYFAAEPMDLRLPFFRGEELAKRHEIERVGVVGRPRRLDHLHLFTLPPDLLASTATEIVQEHVLLGSRNSPFKSWSRSARIAAHFATNGGIAVGLILRAEIHIVSRHVWSTPSGWSQAFRDSLGRTLIPTGSFRTPTHHEVTHPREMDALRTLGAEDQEFLLLGRVHPYEIRFDAIKRRETSWWLPAT